MATLWRALLCLCCVASHLSHRHSVLCSDGQQSQPLLINTPSSALTEGSVLHTFTPSSSSYQLISSQDQDCPSDTFSITSGSNLVLVRDITITDGTVLSPSCKHGMADDPGFPSIRTYRCLVVRDRTVRIPFTVNVEPAFQVAELVFHQTFYTATMVEGRSNATLSIITPHFRARTLPVEGLLVPRYRVTGSFSHMFAVVHEQAGCTSLPVIVTTEPLNRETMQNFELILEAYAPYNDTITASTVLQVTVLDINDNPPQFTNSTPDGFQVSVNSDILPGTELAQYFATDIDFGPNSETRFLVPIASPEFSIHPLNGALFLFKALNGSESYSSEVNVLAEDLGSPTLSTPSRSLTIFVARVSSGSLEIIIHGEGEDSTVEQQVTIVSVSEHAAVGEQVTTIDVTNQRSTDLNLVLTNAGPCECFSLSTPTSITAGLTYSLQVASALDFELNPDGQYRVVLTASDGPTLTTTAELLIQVTDENDLPSFPRNYSIEVAEGVPVGAIVGQVMAEDPDNGTNGTLSYSFTAASSMFQIDSDFGLISTLSEIDFEAVSSPQLTIAVIATDGSGETATTSLHITVTDRNDNPPIFLPTSADQSVSIPEGYNRDRSIFQFVAEDADSECNGAVKYSIIHADPDVFSLGGSSGLLYPKNDSSLDFEKFQSALVVVGVQDLGLEVRFSAQTTLHVNLTDVNDEAPIIDPIGCPCFIGENLHPSSPEARCPPLSASDRDAENTNLVFAISSGNTTLFQIDGNTGVVSTRLLLDREISDRYILEVSVSDGIHVSLPMPLTVIVVDENDQTPTYSQASVVFTVPTDAEPGFLVGKLNATDSDVGYNSLVNYVMVQPSPQTEAVFRLNPLSGMLHTRTTLPASPTTYTFTTSARSLVSPQDPSASKMVTIHISGLKNNPPRFRLPVDHHTISVTHLLGSTVAQIEVEDTDAGMNGQLNYNIAEANTNHSGLFSVHFDGTLRLAQDLSGQVGRVFAVNVSVTDSGSPALQAHQLLLVSVYSSMYQSGNVELVYNSGAGACHYSTSVVELQDTSEIILQLPPTQDSTPIAYSIQDQGQTPASAFQISTGSSLQVQSGFRPVFTETVFITLVAEYSPNFHFCSVTVAIDDINNNAPAFEDASTSFQLYSSTPTGASVFKVTASDADVGSNADTVYSITNTTQLPFSVDPESGDIWVSGVLSQRRYRFTVSAVDPGFSSPASTITVTAEVLGTTNQRPVFSSPSSPLTIPEGSGTQRPSVISDGDGDTNYQATNTFCIASGNLHGAFRIARMGGELMTTDAFDFETLPSEFDVTLMAYDMSLNPTFGLSTVRVVVQDENEPPVFTVSEYRASVMEGVNVSFSVLDVTAVDEDAGSNGVVTYSISSEFFFSIDNRTGVISTSSNLNSNFNEEIVFNVTATDGAGLSAMAKVRVSVTDTNNNCPTPSIPGPVTVPEDVEVGSEVFQIEANDMDDGANAVTSFAIVSGNDGRYFALDPWTGSLRLARALDFEQGPMEFILTLRLRNLDDSLSCSDDHTLVIRVMESNDHFPVFSAAVYDCNVTESLSADRQPATCRVSATDADRTGNRVEYSFIGTPPFNINATTGIITQRASTISVLDRLESPAYVLQVQATDSHNPPKVSRAIVRVNVVDANNPPSPGSQVSHSFVFFEGAPQNTLLSFAHMHDVDSTPSFSTITYQILGQSSLFRLDEQTGAVFLNGELDYETMASPLTFSVIGTNSEHDSGTSSTLQYLVTIGDVNENFLPPVFTPQSNPAVVSLSRSASNGFSVVTLSATDPEGHPVRYDITGGSGVGYFQINPSSGEVTTIFPLTSVSSSQLSLVVRALDDNTFPLPAWHQVTIVLTQQLSMLPQFIRSVFRASPLEGSSSVVAFVRAEQDELNDTPICYSLLDSTNTFSIDQQTGAIILNSNSTLDREITPLYNVTVGAGTTQFPDTSLALLIIEPTDTNDNRPSFTLGDFDFRVPANLPLDEGLVRIFAVDDDADGVLRYNMTTVPVDSPFTLSESGVLNLTRPLNRTEATTHTLTVAVTDGLLSAQESTVIVTVDPPPMNSDVAFDPIPVVTRSESTPLGTLLTTVTSTFTQGTVLYRIQGLPPTVSIHPSTGEVYLTAPLDYETHPSLIFTVEALDGHHNPPIATILQIMVTDVNDNRPLFLQPAYTFTISEDFGPGMTAGRVDAYASDRDTNDVLTYALVDSTHPSSANIFNVTSGGVIIGSSRVDREVLPFHTLTVGVSDNRNPPLRDFVTVTINVEDVDDNVPRFVPSEVSVYLPEDTTQGEVVYTVRAFDPDEGSNSNINYRLVAGSMHFGVNATTGDVTLAMSLDAEQRMQHSLEISAFNPSNPQSISTRNLNLSIHVIDILDSTPELVVENMATVRENYPPYSYVTRVQATPTSSSTPRQVYYSIVGGNALGHFIMEPLTGVVRTTTSLDREAVPVYRLAIQGAYGIGFVSHVNLTIMVGDANDESPHFPAPFISIQVPEDAVFGTPLPSLNITDPDEGRIGSVVIADSYAAEIFSIDNSGRISLNRNQQLDREGRFSEIRFTVYAIDSGTTQKFSAADVQIEVTDQNDPPRFEQSQYAFILGTPALVGVPQFRVQAEDEDTGSHGDITYSISGDSTFSITPETGEISVMDVFMLQETYSLTVTATDGGGLRTTADLTITTEPCNFMNLTFSPSTAQMSVQVFENASAGDVLVSGSDLTIVDLEKVGSSFIFSLPMEDLSFSINSQSGDISVTNLDREAQQLHMLVIQAVDSADPTRVAQAMLSVAILDINDNAPAFNQSRYSVSITTEAAAGSNLLRVLATDADGIGPNSEIIYSIVSQSSSFFSIEESTGILSLLPGVLRESINQITVMATDRGDPPMSSTVMVTVNVVDPRAPRFLQDIYTVTVSENTNISANILTVMLAANTSQGSVSFRFINTESPFPFSISGSGISADISLVDPGLNYEVRTNYTLYLRARDSVANLNGFANVTVYVEDFNDNFPVFESFGLYSENVLENVTIGTTIAQVSAMDADSNINAEITYQLGEDNSGGIFFVDSLSGEIVLDGGTLDFEQEDSHTIEVLAVDGGSPALTATATVVITVGNINDNPPIFSQQVYTTSVRDDDSPRSTNLFVFATDLDQLRSLVYDIVEGGDAFTVSSNGLISLNISNPSEESYRLNISAFDGLFYGFTTVLVSVEGINSAPPAFNESVYTGMVVESSPAGVFVAQVFATDTDRGSNGRITYSLQSPPVDFFSINETSGIITTTETATGIDREVTTSFILQVTATDGGSFSSHALVSILVGDVNDNAPIFEILNYSGTVVARSPGGTDVLQVSAFDRDIEENGRITYMIAGPSGIFAVHPETGVIFTLVAVDLQLSSRTITVSARDNGMPSRTASVVAMVSITVTEGNLRVPVFGQDPYIAHLLENATIGTLVTQVAFTSNNATSCSPLVLQGDTTRFQLQLNSRIVLINNADIEVRNYTLRIEVNCVYVEEGEANQRQGTTTVIVVVEDINERPSFNVFFLRGTVPENIIGRNVEFPVQIMVENDDGTVAFSLTGEGSDLFDITQEIGIIVTRERLDFESTRSYELEIIATDMGSPPLSATLDVLVVVTDVNDNPPVFDQETYFVNVSESAVVGMVVHTARATDLDADSMITYSISGSTFTIDGMSGEVSVATPLDRETTANFSEVISAFDGVNITVANLVFTVTDVNDRVPVFNASIYDTTIPENYATGVTFIQVSATDADEGINAIVSYEQVLTSNSVNGNITVNRTTGEISFQEPPDREEGEEFTLSIQAFDSGTPSLSSTVSVIVRLLDENDNPPRFTRSSYTAGIRENLPPGSLVDIDLVERVEAVDPDNRENGTVSYTIHGEGASYFSIVNRDLISLVQFDREANSSIGIIVIATDGGTPPMSSNATVLINILDQNDNSPMFPQSIFMINVSELATPNTLIFNVSAMDLDSGDNGIVSTYGISGANSDDFRLDTETGRIYVQRALDHEDELRRHYDLTLIAIDSGPDLRRGSTTLIINIVNENDNGPDFTEDTYSSAIQENATIGTVVVTVRATDSDNLGQTQLIYSLRNPGNHPEFHINEFTGEISIAATLDFEANTSYELVAIASDMENEEDNANVIINVIDINDNPPRFLPHQQTLTIEENNDEGYPLVTLVTDDADDISDPATRTYSITAGNIGDAFRISRLGNLTVQRSLDREDISRYNLTISATDHTPPSLTGSTFIVVNVRDVNDNSPTGGHQEIFINLLNGVPPSIPLGSVFVNDSDVTNSHRYRLNLPTPGGNNIRIDASHGTISVNRDSLQVGTFNFTVFITDAPNSPANTTIVVTITDVSEETLPNSFRVQLDGVTPDEFVDNHFSSFLEEAKRVVERELLSTVDIQAISIQTSSSPFPPENTDMTLAVSYQNNTYADSHYVQHILHSNREQLGRIVGVAIATVSVDACSLEPCAVDQTCTNSYSEGISDLALGTQSIVYVGITSTLTHRCLSISSSPCGLGACPGASSCQLEVNRRGDLLSRCVQDCSSFPCRNNGECFDQNPGYYCRCPEGFNGRNCELTLASFSQDSFAVFPGLSTRSFGSLSLEFNTNNGGDTLLMHSGRFDSIATDSFSLYFENTEACLAISRGGDVARGCVSSWGETTLGQGDSVWHSISIQYNSTGLVFSSVTYDPYTQDMHESSIAMDNQFHSLDLDAPIIVGRLPEEFGYHRSDGFPSSFNGFRGCLRNLLINGEPLDFSAPLTASGLSEGCGCGMDTCKNGGVCYSTGLCDCQPEYSGEDCSEESPTVSFLGDNYISYTVQSTAAQPLKRRRRQAAGGDLYVTAQTRISLSFITDEADGTLLQLGDPHGSSEYLLLQITTGYIQLRCNLGNGEHTLALQSQKVNDAESHTVLVTRTEGALEVLLDERFFNQTTLLGSGNNILLEISPQDIFFGAEVDVESGEIVLGFKGCVTGARLNRKELPFDSNGNEDFAVDQLQLGGAAVGFCFLGALNETSHPDEYVFGALGVILFILILISLVFVALCSTHDYRKRSSQGHHNIQRANSSPAHGGFMWRSAYSPSDDRKSPSPNEAFSMVTLLGEQRPVNSRDGGVAETGLANPINSRQGRPQSPVALSRPESARSMGSGRMSVPPPDEGFTAVSQSNPGFLQESPESSSHDILQQEGRSRFVRHMQSLVRQQSDGTKKSDNTAAYIPTELLAMDDVEVKKFIRKKVEAADEDNEDYDVDKMEPFGEEGEFEPLGSIGSLYDFVKDLDDAPSAQRPPGQSKVSAANKPAGTVTNQSRLPQEAAGYSQPTTSSSLRPSSPTRRSGRGKRPKPVIVRSPPSAAPPPPPQNLANGITTATTIPIRSASSPAPALSQTPPSPPPPGYETKSRERSTEPLLSSPEFSPEHKSAQNGHHWVLLSKHSASQPETFDLNGSAAGGNAQKGAAKLRRSGRRPQRVNGPGSQNKDAKNILEKFHHVTTSPNPFGTTEESNIL